LYANSGYSLLDGPRALAQTISYEVRLARQTIQLALLIVWFALQRKNDQPEDGPWKGRKMPLREAM